MKFGEKILFCFLYVFVFVGYTFAQWQIPATINDAKTEMLKLYGHLYSLDKEFDTRIETEISKQVSTAPKDEFETSKQYAARLVKIRSLRARLQLQYEPERTRRRQEIQERIAVIYELEFEGPVSVELQAYNADGGYFNVIAKDNLDIAHNEIMMVPQNLGRETKEQFDKAKLQGLYGVTYDGVVTKAYYFGFRANVAGRTFTSLPPAAEMSGDLSRYYLVYTEATVQYLRKTIDKYLKNPESVSELERETLDAIDKTYLRSKFVVVEFSPFLVGGKWIKILFVDRPDAMFLVWVYRILEIRSFEKEENDDRHMRIIRTLYKPFLKDKKHIL